MKKMLTIAAAVLLLAGCQGGNNKSAGTSNGAALDSESAKFSYALGLDVGRSLSHIDEKMDMDAFNKGVSTALAGKEPELSAKEILEVKQAVFKREQAKLMVKQQQAAGENKKASEEFLKKNASAAGVKSTASGLQYKVLTEGSGPKPTLDDTVKVDYEGKLLDGKVFDSSYKRGKPAVFPLRNVIKGWQEGLQLMPVGSKYRLFVPADLAYGDTGAGGVIGPNQVLIFDVQLLAIEHGKQTSKANNAK